MRYDSGACVGYEPHASAKIINRPPDHVIGMLLEIGKKKPDAYGRGGQLPYEEVVHDNRFPDAST